MLYAFTGGEDGKAAIGPVTFDAEEDIYATTTYGGNDYGTVIKLTPSEGGHWTESVLHAFTGGNDGALPSGGVIFGQDGDLYGTALSAGSYGGGTAYQLVPSESGWTENVLHNFQGGDDGQNPWDGLILDPAGNMYGVTWGGGSGNDGTAYMLSPSGGGWMYTILFSFRQASGGGPSGRLVMDAAGNLYGSTVSGANGYGSVFKLTPSPGGWTYTLLYAFAGGSDGGYPLGRVLLDANGKLYGTAQQGGVYGYGVVWEISLNSNSAGPRRPAS